MVLQRQIAEQPPKAPVPPEAERKVVREATGGALNSLRAEIDLGTKFTEIEHNQKLNDFEKFAKKIEVCFEAFKGEIDKITEILGLKEEEVTPFIPHSEAPREDLSRDAEEGNVPAEKIKPSEERDILGFLKERRWLDYVKKACQKFQVPVFVLLSIIRRESSFNPNAYTYIDPRTGKIASSARGLGQFLNSGWGLEKDGVTPREKGGFLNASLDENPWGKKADRLNPEHAIWATAWHIRNHARAVDRFVSQGVFPEHFRLNLKNATPHDVKWIYMAYMNGAWGYCVLRRYLESKTDEERARNYERLTGFQKRKAAYKNVETGEVIVSNTPPEGKEWKRVIRNHIDGALKCANGGVATALNFERQIRERDPSLARIHLVKPEAYG